MSSFFETAMAVQMGMTLAQHQQQKKVVINKDEINQPSISSMIDPNLPADEWMNQFCKIVQEKYVRG